MPLIQAQDRQQIEQEFEKRLENPVKLVVFTQTFECQHCATNRQMAEEVASISDQVELEVYNFVTDKEMAESYGVDKIPAIAIVGDKDYGVRYYGVPSGYEFSSLVADIIGVSQGDSGLSPATRQALTDLSGPVHLQVLVTPTCPYCPQVVRLAHQFAIESEQVRADMVEVTEFPHLVQKYEVMGVPRTVINETVFVEGAVPETAFVEAILDALTSAKQEAD